MIDVLTPVHLFVLARPRARAPQHDVPLARGAEKYHARDLVRVLVHGVVLL